MQTAARPPVYPWSPLRLALLHAILPLLAAIVLPAAGALLGGSWGAAAGGPEATGWAASVGVFLVFVRAFDAAKGPLPIILLMPVPTPVGDLSVLSVLAWQSDAVLITLVVAGGLTVALHAAGAFAGLWLAIALVCVAALAWRRFAKADHIELTDRVTPDS